MQVAVYFDGGGTALLPAYQAVLALVKKKNIFYQTLKAGDHFDCGAVNFYVLGPPSEKILSKSPVNNNSVVVRLKYKNVAILLAGDAENEEEESILNLAVQLNLDIKSNVIKIGHHGSATATSYEFLCAVAPEMAIISCGTHNRFSHPHGATLSKLAQAGIQIFRTDKRGALWLETEGVGVRCNPTGGVL
jgi:competence protein ComEC